MSFGRYASLAYDVLIIALLTFLSTFPYKAKTSVNAVPELSNFEAYNTSFIWPFDLFVHTIAGFVPLNSLIMTFGV